LPILFERIRRRSLDVIIKISVLCTNRVSERILRAVLINIYGHNVFECSRVHLEYKHRMNSVNVHQPWRHHYQSPNVSECSGHVLTSRCHTSSVTGQPRLSFRLITPCTKTPAVDNTIQYNFIDLRCRNSLLVGPRDRDAGWKDGCLKGHVEQMTFQTTLINSKEAHVIDGEETSLARDLPACSPCSSISNISIISSIAPSSFYYMLLFIRFHLLNLRVTNWLVGWPTDHGFHVS